MGKFILAVLLTVVMAVSIFAMPFAKEFGPHWLLVMLGIAAWASPLALVYVVIAITTDVLPYNCNGGDDDGDDDGGRSGPKFPRPLNPGEYSIPGSNTHAHMKSLRGVFYITRFTSARSVSPATTFRIASFRIVI